MTYFKSVGTATVIATLMSTTAVYADFTAEGAWNQFVAMSKEQGASSVTGTTATSGGTLTVSDLVMSFDPEVDAVDAEDVKVAFTAPSVVFTENGDGTVAMTFDGGSSMSVDLPDGAEVDVLSAQFSATGYVTTFSGEAGDYTVATVADEFVATLDPIVDGSVSIDPKAVLTITGLTSTQSRKDGDLITVDANATIENTTFTMDLVLPDDEGAVKIDFAIADATSTAKSTLVPGVSAQDTVAQLAGGMSSKGNFGYGATVIDVFLQSPDGPMDIAMTRGKGSIDFDLDKDGVEIATTAFDTVETFTIPGLPLPPMSATYAESAFDLEVPFGSEAAGDYGLVMKMAGLTIDDSLWGMFDPAAIMPRDEVDLTLDVSGKMKWLVDLFADDIEDQFMNADVPVEVNSFQLNEFLLSAVGAKATGSGAVEFDLTDTVTYDGMPAPVGSFSLTLEGANGVLDKIVQMGFLSAEDAMGARMMSGMFLKAGEGDDVLTSDIDLTEDKQVLVNGVRVK